MTATRAIGLRLLPERYAVCRLEPGAAVPAWAADAPWTSLTRTRDELSIVCADERVPEGVRVERGWRCLAVLGPIAFSEIGILAALSTALAGAGVSVFAISTFDTDYLLVAERQLDAAVAALHAAGHEVAPG